MYKTKPKQIAKISATQGKTPYVANVTIPGGRKSAVTTATTTSAAASAVNAHSAYSKPAAAEMKTTYSRKLCKEDQAQVHLLLILLLLLAEKTARLKNLQAISHGPATATLKNWATIECPKKKNVNWLTTSFKQSGLKMGLILTSFGRVLAAQETK